MPEDRQLAEPVAADKAAFPQFKGRKQLQRDIEHITQEMYRRNRELAETNKTLSLLRTVDALVLESHASVKTVCEHITQAITQVTDYPFVGLFTRASPTLETLTLYGYSGHAWLGKDTSLEFARPVHLKIDHEWFSLPEDSRLISLENLDDKLLPQFLDCSEADIARFRRAVPLKSLYAVKLLARRRLVGLLVVGFLSPAEKLGEADTALLDRVSDSIGVALDNKLLFEENQHVLKELQTSNKKLQALDEAKDDFISMASHQLRTPLTSVKGYISMVLEGDAGKLTPTQKQLLQQSFISSQRMVFLIADLLNVSRLRTGKFVIEPAPVNLAQVVQEEVDQLVETAKGRQLDLIYKKPAKFPELMLDETKIRQVIMNFIDNAIYYTPAGGSITVSLHETAASVELRVKDTGIGVPKSEQAHLFSKFYRAGNARKARPDGTGLGLFMAKKVIIAQGGATIFETKEGKGSTFGFIFSKSKLAVPANAAKTAAPDGAKPETEAKAAEPSVPTEA